MTRILFSFKQNQIKTHLMNCWTAFCLNTEKNKLYFQKFIMLKSVLKLWNIRRFLIGWLTPLAFSPILFLYDSKVRIFKKIFLMNYSCFRKVNACMWSCWWSLTGLVRWYQSQSPVWCRYCCFHCWRLSPPRILSSHT